MKIHLPSALTSLQHPQARRFLRRLKLDVADEDRAALLDALVGSPSSSDIGGQSKRGSGERGVSFESDGGRKKRAKRGGGGGGKSDGDSECGGGGGGGAARVLYRDFLELVLADQVCMECGRCFLVMRFLDSGRLTACFLRCRRESEQRRRPYSR